MSVEKAKYWDDAIEIAYRNIIDQPRNSTSVLEKDNRMTEIDDLMFRLDRAVSKVDSLFRETDFLIHETEFVIREARSLFGEPSTPRAENAQPSGDLFKPRLVFIGSDGKVTADTDLAVAVVLPQYRRMFALKVEEARDWDDANEIAAKCNVLTFADWYLPSVKELELLICRDPAPMAPTTYSALIKHTPFHDWYWSIDLHPSDSSIAFGVYLTSGFVHWGCRSNSGLVRACREVSESELQKMLP